MSGFTDIEQLKLAGISFQLHTQTLTHNDQSISNVFVTPPLIDRRQPAKEKEAKKRQKAENKLVLNNRKLSFCCCGDIEIEK